MSLAAILNREAPDARHSPDEVHRDVPAR
jgi:hypothetical protein